MTIGEQITLEDLERDPYPIYARPAGSGAGDLGPRRSAVARDAL